MSKRIIATLLLVIMLSPIIISPLVVKADIADLKYDPFFGGNTEWQMTLSDSSTSEVGGDSSIGLNGISNKITLRKDNFSKGISHIWGWWEDADKLTLDRIYTLSTAGGATKDTEDSTKIINKDEFYISYFNSQGANQGRVYLNQVETLADLHKLSILYEESDRKITGAETFSDIPIQWTQDYNKAQSIGRALKQLDLTWIKNNYIIKKVISNTSNDVSNLDKYTKDYSFEDLQVDDTDLKTIKEFYHKFKSNHKEELDDLIWWFDTYKSTYGEKSIEDLAKDITFQPKDDLERFIVYCILGEPLTEDKNHAQVVADAEDTLTGAGSATDVTKFEDWLRAVVYMHEGKTPSDENPLYIADFLDYSNLKSNIKDRYKLAQILTILNLPNSKMKVDLTDWHYNISYVSTLFKGYTRYDTDAVITNQSNIMKTSLDNITNLGEEDYDDWIVRMLTFEDRVNYLVCASSLQADKLDEAIETYYTNPNTNLILNPDLSYIDIGDGSLINGKYTIKNAEAYTYLVSTISELYSISREIPNKINTCIENNTISSQKKYIEGILNVYNGLRLIDSPQAWELWSRPFDYDKTTGKSKSGNYISLQEVYEKLLQLGAFSGLDVSAEFSSDRPLGNFMDLDSEVLSPLYLKGIAYSATYIPMQTNLYDPYTIAGYDEDFLNKFYYIYGFHRKALYIDTNSSAAVDLYNTSRKGETKVCTLKDLLNADKDIVLYLDDNFYNVNKLAELQGESFNRLDNVDEDTDTRPWYQKLWSKVIDNFEVDIYEQTKTAEQTSYSDKLRKKVASTDKHTYKADAVAGYYDKDGKWIISSTGQPSADGQPTDNVDQYVLTSSQIKDYLDGVTTTTDINENGDRTDVTSFDSYNVLMAYAVVSATYRDKVMFNKSNSVNVRGPVFISSDTLATISGTSDYDKGSILNYMLLKNIEGNIPVDYNYNLDMESPVYMDIFGNIVTESGYVVVPAACNATLFNKDYSKDLYNVGLFSIYGDTYSLPSSYQNVSSVLDSAFEIDNEFGIWKLKSRTIDDTLVDYARLTTGDKESAKAVQNQFEYNLSDAIKSYNFDKYFNICTEVLRGAPIESIDKNFEGLNTSMRLSKAGLTAAAKLEEIDKALDSKSGNSILSLPNLAFVDGLEYVVVFAFKVVTFIVIAVLMVVVFVDAVGTQFSWRTILKCLSAVVLTIITIITVPTVFKLTYYESNKLLLQKEAAYTCMLNLEKRQSGIEVGVTDVTTPDITTKMLVKLDDIEVPWWDILSNVMLSSTFDNLEQVYSSYAESVPSSSEPDVTIMNDGVYMYTDDIFDSADINIDLKSKNLYMRTDETLTTSFYSPYYAILQTLISRVNEFNYNNNWYAYNTKVQKGGKLKTLGLISQYLTSSDFMDSEGDILGMDRIHGIEPSLYMTEVFSSDELEVMSKSLWDNTVLSDEEIQKRTTKLSEYARNFVAENRYLLGKVSDETFLKVMSMSLAMYHNKLFGVNSADCYEIYNFSNDDLIRLSVADRKEVLTNSTLTYGRFVYEVGGTPAVYAAAILSVITWVSSYVKPICTILVFLAIFISIFIFKICLRKKSANLYGYAVTTILLCLCNMLHSILIKSSIWLPTVIPSTTACLLIQAFLQLAYMGVLARVTYIAFRDWHDLGFDRYQSMLMKLKANILPNKHRVSKGNSLRPKNNWEYYNRMIRTHKERNGGRY